jgi:hypothetical protein
MESLATVDWLIFMEGAAASLADIKEALGRWPGGTAAADRKKALFTDKLLDAAVNRLRGLNDLPT